MTEDSFYKDLERGKYGENMVRYYFEKEGCHIKDVSDDRNFQLDDIDFIVADSTTYEVKTDYRYEQTGNLALEDSYYYFDSNQEGKGWLWTSKADKFAFVNPANPNCFVSIGAETLRKIVKRDSLKTAYHNNYDKAIKLRLIKPREYKEFFECHYL